MKIYVLALVLFASTVICNAQIIFSDDFESGNLDKWTTDIRYLAEGIHFAQVTEHRSSNAAHVFKAGLSSIKIISPEIAYRDDLHFSFDMETEVHTVYSSPDTENYSLAGASFRGYNINDEQIFHVNYAAKTTTYMTPFYTDNANNYQVVIDEGFDNYSLGIQEIMSYVTFDLPDLDYVTLSFVSFSSTVDLGMQANVWADNIIVTPEPASLLLLGLGAVAVRRRCKSLS